MYPTEQEAIEHTAALVDSRDDALTLIAALRAQLDDAHQHVGALIKVGEDALAEVRITNRTDAALRSTLSAARAWLRREAK